MFSDWYVIYAQGILMRVTPITPTANAAYKKPRFLVSVSWNKTTIIDTVTGDRKEFDDAKSAWEYKVELEA